jgi:hypothetical protein
MPGSLNPNPVNVMISTTIATVTMEMATLAPVRVPLVIPSFHSGARVAYPESTGRPLERWGIIAL